jgi:hypothetical protein
MNLPTKIVKYKNAWFVFPLIIILLGFLVYGIQVANMGFYWDDWPWVWFSHVLGPAGMLQIDAEHRPLSGLVLLLGSLLFGDNPIGWQVYNLVFRLAGCFSLWWMLSRIWPQNQDQNKWIVLLFLVYPGFSQQFVAVNSSRHLLPLTFFFISIGLMVKADQINDRRWMIVGLSILFSLGEMLTTEYYYGLELVRPLILWIAPNHHQQNNRVRLTRAVKSWIPFLIPLSTVFIWRYSISKSVNYQITLFSETASTSGISFVERIWQALQDVLTAGFVAWGRIFQFPDPNLFGQRVRLYYWGIVFIGFIIALFFSFSSKTNLEIRRWGLEAMLLGGAVLLLAPIPFWVAGLDLKLSFPFDRLTLPSMVGACILLVSLVEILIHNQLIKVLLLSGIIAFSVGFHYLNSVGYRRDWQNQAEYFQQLTWRIPRLKDGTALLSNELPLTYSTDNSLTAPINWIFAPGFKGGDLPYYMFYVKLRFGNQGGLLTKEMLSTENFRLFSFSGTPDQVLVIYNNPPACLRVLDSDRDANFPDLSEEIESVLQYSNLDLLSLGSGEKSGLPLIFPIEYGDDDWCANFERADLSRQREDWQAVVQYADLALQAGFPDAPIKHITEYEVFIEGYAHNNNWDSAQALTLEAVNISETMAPFLCDTWIRILDHTEASMERSNAVSQIEGRLDCSLQ